MPPPFMRTPAPAPRHSPGEDALALTGGLLLGALVGAVAAIALAPTDGATLRQRIAERVRDILGDGFPIPGAGPHAPEAHSGDAALTQDVGESSADVIVASADGRPGAAPAAPS